MQESMDQKKLYFGKTYFDTFHAVEPVQVGEQAENKNAWITQENIWR